ncbi:hypothetical protein GCM10022251_31800 [Phytohabitans flavus]|uniref:Uncharacterized protein n=1 Tax=Phytohabitans flavus TaxID=1076124 RepID=A0A6F8XWN4_9ACTN|nr:hypothetical protein [Phytohabitans flavus]BCB78220.1 hypothetical protein Pflav_046300 [Phytohabitans flavus]
MAVTPPTRAELEAIARSTFALLDIDISVLPVNDPAAPMDQARIIEASINILAKEPILAAYEVDGQADATTLYPTPFLEWTR